MAYIRKLAVRYLLIFLLFSIGFTYYFSKQSEYVYNYTAIIQNAVQVSKTAPSSNILSFKIRKGDNFGSLLAKAGITSSEVQEIILAAKKEFDLTKISIGQQMIVTLDPVDRSFAKLEMKTDIDKNLLIIKQNGLYQSSTITIPLFKKQMRAGGIITNSLIGAAKESGVSEKMMMEAISAFSYDIDFQRDIKAGNRFEVIFDRYYNENGEKVKDSEVLFASIKLSDREISVYRYIDADGNAGYYDVKGQSIKKSLLRTPVDGARITSSFGMRKHPILGYSKMHKGVDFAAPTGTPIYAAGDGAIEYVGSKGAYGNYIKIKHSSTYATAYAHISRFASGIRNGGRVKQGQVIAYVGTTGRSTGPHLHFEVIENGNQINPAIAKVTPGKKLEGNELQKFLASKKNIEARITAHNKINPNIYNSQKYNMEFVDNSAFAQR